VLVACLFLSRNDCPEPVLASLSSAAFLCRVIPYNIKTEVINENAVQYILTKENFTMQNLYTEQQSTIN
jgi:hypothetical protein